MSAGVNTAEDGKESKAERFRHGKEFWPIDPALQNGIGRGIALFPQEP